MDHALAAAGAGQVVLFGGSYVPYSDTWVYDLGANTWIEKSPAAAPPARRGHGLASLGADQVLLFGGLDADYIRLGDSWVYVLGEDEWTQWLPAVSPSARNDHAMASTGSDQVLLFGGMDGNYDGETWLATGFLFIPSTAVYLPLVTR